jgi:hypothetical protein
MPSIPSKLTGSGGEHFVACKLSAQGFVAALPREGAPSVDILASNLDGGKTVAIQVKTTDSAMHTRGRGKNRKPADLQFPLGHHCAKLNGENLLFAFVDMNGLQSETQPDLYVIPSRFVFDCCTSWVDKVKMVRLHITIAQMDQFKNNWKPVTARLT